MVASKFSAFAVLGRCDGLCDRAKRARTRQRIGNKARIVLRVSPVPLRRVAGFAFLLQLVRCSGASGGWLLLVAGSRVCFQWLMVCCDSCIGCETVQALSAEISRFQGLKIFLHEFPCVFPKAFQIALKWLCFDYRWLALFGIKLHLFFLVLVIFLYLLE